MWLILVSYAFSSDVSFRSAQPISWMHATATGESPGWRTSNWFQFESSLANVWNAPAQFQSHSTDTSQDLVLSYAADYEQHSNILEIGHAFTSQMAIAIEIAHAKRDGGGLDELIDRFHQVIGAQRFSRQYYDDFNSQFSISVGDQERVTRLLHDQWSYLKYKLKYWWIEAKTDRCPCGLATSLQVKQPLAAVETGFSSGGWDTSLVAHVGVPIRALSSVYLTAAYTWIGSHDLFSDWPIQKHQQMYELSLQMASSATFSYVFQLRWGSPWMKPNDFSIMPTAEDQKGRDREQIASGLNSLKRWRVFNSLGFRYEFLPGISWTFLFLEDLAIGQVDPDGSSTYTINAPDIALINQLHFQY